MDNLALCPRCGTLARADATTCTECKADLSLAVVEEPLELAVDLAVDAGPNLLVELPHSPEPPPPAEVLTLCPKCRRALPPGKACPTCASRAAAAEIAALAAAPAPARSNLGRTLGGAAAIAGLIGGGILFAQHQEKKRNPLPSFAAMASAAPAAAEEPPAVAAAPPAAAADIAASPRPATPAGPTTTSFLWKEELLFGGQTAAWWATELQARRTAADPQARALYPLAKARAERAGLVVEERADQVTARPSEAVLAAALKRSEP